MHDSNKTCVPKVPKLALGMLTREFRGPAQHAMTHAVGTVKLLVMWKQGLDAPSKRLWTWHIHITEIRIQITILRKNF